MALAPRVLIDGPTPQALQYGLFTVLAPVEPQNPHWHNGIEWEDTSCAPALHGIGDADCEPETSTTGLPRPTHGGDPMRSASPFTVSSTYSCSPVGNEVEHARQRATARLLMREEARVEQALWTGDLGNRSFATDADDLGAAADVRHGIARIERWIARELGVSGIVHMGRDVALLGLEHGALVAKGNTLFTGLGNRVVAGAGYGRTDDTATSDTIFVTGPMVAVRSEVFVAADVREMFDTAKNDLYAVAERSYAIGWDCGSAKVTVTL